jgi:hypothetical protein
MIYALEERIGDPSLFCGRNQEMELLLNWVGRIKTKRAKSKALLGRRKSGKSAIMERLFNILWNRNDRIVPFYFEIEDKNICLLEFASDYLKTLLTHYLSFLTRTPLSSLEIWEWKDLEAISKKINNNSIPKRIELFQDYFQQEREEQAIHIAVKTPYWLYGKDKHHFVIMLDEIQYMTQYIYYDRAFNIKAYNLPGIYHGPVEHRVCPMLVSGSYIGWMNQMISKMFVAGRLKSMPISSSLSFDEGMTAVYTYAALNHIDLNEDLAMAINIMAQSNPYYIATIFETEWPESDFTSLSGISKTFAHEIIDPGSDLHKTWLEYIYSTLNHVNELYAKKILLTLSRERDKEFARDELLQEIGWPKDKEPLLEEKLRTLIYGDLITEGSSAYHYKGISDHVLYLIFYHKYEFEIYHKQADVQGELYKKIESLEKDKSSMQGQINELKGRMLELVVWRELNACRKRKATINNFRNRLRPIVSNKDILEKTICVVENMTLDMVWMNYFLNPPSTTPLEMDVFALKRETDSNIAIVFETKNRNEKNLPTIDDCKIFFNKMDILKQTYEIDTPITMYGIYFSANGLSDDVEKWLQDKGILTIDWETWHNTIKKLKS